MALPAEELKILKEKKRSKGRISFFDLLFQLLTVL